MGLLCRPGATRAATLTVEAPPSLAGAAARVSSVNLPQLENTLARAGLDVPDRIAIVLVAEDDPRARSTPSWIVGYASGERDITILPDRVLSYPYDSLESVVRHEIVHLALTTTARGRALPRWFHEGVAVLLDSGWGVSSRVELLLAMRTSRDTADLGRLFSAGTQPDAALAYRLSAAFVEDLRRRHGRGLPGALASRVGDGRPFDEAFELETGTTPDAAAARAWSTYRRATAWIAALTRPSTLWVAIVLLALAAFVVRSRQRARRRRRWDEEEW